jgi:hypothetical protein
MKNKPDLALLRPSNLSNELKSVPKSRETIPLNRVSGALILLEPNNGMFVCKVCDNSIYV